MAKRKGAGRAAEALAAKPKIGAKRIPNFPPELFQKRKIRLSPRRVALDAASARFHNATEALAELQRELESSGPHEKKRLLSGKELFRLKIGEFRANEAWLALKKARRERAEEVLANIIRAECRKAGLAEVPANASPGLVRKRAEEILYAEGFFYGKRKKISNLLRQIHESEKIEKELASIIGEEKKGILRQLRE